MKLAISVVVIALLASFAAPAGAPRNKNNAVGVPRKSVSLQRGLESVNADSHIKGNDDDAFKEKTPSLLQLGRESVNVDSPNKGNDDGAVKEKACVKLKKAATSRKPTLFNRFVARYKLIISAASGFCIGAAAAGMVVLTSSMMRPVVTGELAIDPAGELALVDSPFCRGEGLSYEDILLRIRGPQWSHDCLFCQSNC